MSKINVNIGDLEAVVENFLQASKEAGELNYRLKQLGNEFVDDIDLNSSAEYEAIMTAYTQASNSVRKINEFFESLLLYVLKAPELYSQAEKNSVEKINNILKKSNGYQKAVTDSSALESIIQRAQDEDEININALADLVREEYQKVNLSNLAANEINIDEFEQAQIMSNGVENSVNQSFGGINESAASMTNDFEKQRGKV